MSSSGRKIAGGYVLLVAAEIVAKGVTFAAFGFMARRLGPDGQGFVEFAIAVTMCASLVIDLGFNPYGAREIARDPERTSSLVGEIVLARLGLAILAAGVVVALALGTPRSPAQVTLLLVYSLSLLPTPLFLQWVFQGHNQMQWVAIATVIRQVVFAVVVFAMVRGMDTIIWVAIAEVFGVIAASVYCVVVYRRRFAGTIRLGRWVSAKLFQEGVPIGLGQMFWAVRMFCGTVLLGYVALNEEVGQFGAAHRILVAVHTFVWWYFFNLLPTMTRYWHADRAAFCNLLRESLRVVLWVGLLGLILGVLLSRTVMVLTYSAQFAEATPVLQVFVGVCLVLALSGNYRFALIAAGFQKQEMITACVGAIAAVILIFLGYQKWGIVGAGGGLLAAEVMVWMSTWWWARKLLDLTEHWKCYLRPVAALIATCGILLVFKPESAWVAALVACVMAAGVALTDPVIRKRGARVLPRAASQPN